MTYGDNMIRLLPIIFLTLAACATEPVADALPLNDARDVAVSYAAGRYFIVEEGAIVPGGAQ